MAQEIFFNYKDDDLTDRLNHWFLGVLENGIYRGYDFVPTSDLQFTMSHVTTGYTEVDQSGTASNPKGVLITTQGGVIKEDADIVIPIDTNASNDNRIDLIVVTHDYEEIVGGTTALYSVIKGVPATDPVVPGLTTPTTQTIVGTLFLPSGVDTLDSGGVVFTKSTTPDYGGTKKSNIVGINNFSGVQSFTTLNPATLFDYQSIRTLSVNTSGNNFVITESNPIGQILVASDVQEGCIIKLRFAVNGFIGNTPTLNLPENIAGVKTKFHGIDLNGLFDISSGGGVGDINRLTMLAGDSIELILLDNVFKILSINSLKYEELKADKGWATVPSINANFINLPNNTMRYKVERGMLRLRGQLQVGPTASGSLLQTISSALPANLTGSYPNIHTIAVGDIFSGLVNIPDLGYVELANNGDIKVRFPSSIANFTLRVVSFDGVSFKINI